ncbi:MAG: hypothetical protein ABI134_04155, partial [Byssovorax sp.]
MRCLVFLAAPILLALGCSSSDTPPPPKPDPKPVDQGTLISFDLAADLAVKSSFYDLPYPSDLRLTGKGGP